MRPIYKTLTLALLLCDASSLVATAVAAMLNYHVAHRYVLGGDGVWDYLTYDPDGKRLFISRSSHVIVVDPTSGKFVGDIPNTPGVHGITLAPELGKASLQTEPTGASPCSIYTLCNRLRRLRLLQRTPMVSSTIRRANAHSRLTTAVTTRLDGRRLSRDGEDAAESKPDVTAGPVSRVICLGCYGAIASNHSRTCQCETTPWSTNGSSAAKASAASRVVKIPIAPSRGSENGPIISKVPLSANSANGLDARRHKWEPSPLRRPPTDSKARISWSLKRLV